VAAAKETLGSKQEALEVHINTHMTKALNCFGEEGMISIRGLGTAKATTVFHPNAAALNVPS
jgi:hypothetical protein